MKTSKRYQLTASLICADLLRLGEQIEELEEAKVDALEIDIMDGLFVPRLGFPPEIIKFVKQTTSIPVTAHLMINNPGNYIQKFVETGADTIIIHSESTQHLQRVLGQIKESRLRSGVALNPATPLQFLDYIIDDLDTVLIMGINPGIVGHKLIENTLKKISDLKKYLENYPKVKIGVDGGVTFESAKKMINRGAWSLVCGSSTIFSTDNLSYNIKKLRKSIDN